MRGVGATCTAPKTHGRPPPKDAWTSRTDDSPGILQDRRGMNAASSQAFPSERPLSPRSDRSNGVSQASSTGWAGRVRQYASTLKIRATTRVFCGPGDRQAPIFRQESEGEGGIRRRIRRQPAAGRRERTALMFGYGTVGRSSLHALRGRDWAV
jgi:hypothetical protein